MKTAIQEMALTSLNSSCLLVSFEYFSPLWHDVMHILCVSLDAFDVLLCYILGLLALV